MFQHSSFGIFFLFYEIIYSVDMNIFEGIARQALLACTDRFNQAASLIESRTNKMNGNLFLIKHILVLREQISPFEINFTTTESSLDFTSTTQALSTFISSGARLSIFTTFDGTNPLVALIASSVPTVIQEEINTKQLLETQLKSACEAFILNTTTDIVQPLLDVLHQITTFDEESYKKDIAAPEMIVTGEQVNAVLDTVLISIQNKLPKILELLSIYLSNAATELVLFKPVKANINESIHRLRGFMLRFTDEERNLLQPKMDEVESTMRV